MPNIASKTLSKLDAIRMILDCNIAGQYKDKFVHISDVNKNTFVDLPKSVQSDVERYISNGKADLLIRKK